MNKQDNTRINNISDRFIELVCNRLSENKQVRRSLPEWGRIHIDRQLPFLCIYRRQQKDMDSLSDGLITGEASYLTAFGSRKQHKQLSILTKSIAGTLKESFGSFLIVEVWISSEEEQDNKSRNYKGKFKIIHSRKNDIPSTIESLEHSLKEIRIRKEPAEVEIISASKISPPNLPALISPAEASQLGFHIIGIEVSPIYHNIATGKVFPMMQRKLERGFARALKYSFFEFTNNHTSMRPPNYQSLGRRSMVKAVWEVDRQLAEISNEFDFLLQVTPANTHSSWLAFQRKNFGKTPQFIYRPLSIDPALAKRRLYKIPIEKIEDPTLAQLFREQQLELDRKFTMLIDRGTPRFLYGSFQLFGTVDDSLMKVSEELLQQIPPHARDEFSTKSVDAPEFANRASIELEQFRKTIPHCTCKVLLRNDISGLMVSRGNLLVGTRSKIPASRVEALIAHEMGTHVLTYINGRAQPFQQLYTGFPGYDELQEGLAVLSEYMVDGLTGTRMRLLAARVVAARHMTDGATFVEVFRELNKEYGFERRTAYNISTRTFRGGGLTKDAVYLRGLIHLLQYLKNGGELEPLYVGKISAEHVPIVKELQWRKILKPTPLFPAYFKNPNTFRKLNELKNGLTLNKLIKTKEKK